MPRILWDGECGFCGRWVDHWHELTAGAVEFSPFQDVSDEFLARYELDPEELSRAIHFIDADGLVHRGAAAVFEMLRLTRELRFLFLSGLLRRFRPAGWASEKVYQFVASRRRLAGRVTKMMWGQPQRSSYQVARMLFTRVLAIASFLAFWSMSRQVVGLLGAEGILPAAEYLESARSALNARGISGTGVWSVVPTVFWGDASDASLVWACRAGMVASIALFFGVIPRLVIPLIWLCYLSICSVGQIFLGYQWDALLLESLALGWFFVPWAPVPLERFRQRSSDLGRILLWVLLFKLMFLSGFVKIASDPVWTSLSAFDFHFWTQPIPNNVSWWAHQLPGFVKASGVAFTLLVELPLALMIFAPRRLRHMAGLLMISLQVGIMLTGTYGFFNVLTIALCLTLFDDGFFGRLGGRLSRSLPLRARRRTVIAWIVSGMVLLPLILIPMGDRLGSRTEPSAIRRLVSETVGPLRTFNSYGLFAVMTKTRPEVLVEYSDDGESWEAVDFRWKPTDPDEPLRFTTFHLPRLDWQMWFAALGTCARNPWYQSFVERLLQGADEVGALLETAPQVPPRFVRSRYFEYRFSDEGWWEREETGVYCPTLTLDSEGRLARAQF